MGEIFNIFNKALAGNIEIALMASFIWGILSVLLSPCHLASIPLIVAFIDEQGRTSTKRAFVTSTLFSTGILITIALIGVLTAAAGRIAGNIGPWGNYMVAAVFFIVGLHLLGVIPLPFSGPGQTAMKKKGLMAALILGLVFGVALGPCTFAYMAPILAIAFKAGTSNSVYGAALLGLYGLGHCAVIIAAGTSAEMVQKYLNWNEKSKGAVILKKICGALILAGGCYVIYTSP